ncbi:endolytic transglycosylase MltG [Moritella sp. F3]|uniref:endolytic transglycosylase MltG n=1 Tax=Moritella sp. F3 TaxID=2718882 RepID=UPI0018E1CB16|nr:endolytic transglycosylase MltG [Moritella sp. F3]GIC78972.1 aminodeoxychorismate lyase [Moritella sp. F1]GIC83505.1 aminodeoxychorismate lyase [Moritella sp. F3]
MKKIITAVSLLFTILLIACVLFYSRYQSFISVDRVQSDHILTVASGDTAQSIANSMIAVPDMESKVFLRLFFKQNPSITNIKLGSYKVTAGWDFKTLFEHLVSGDEFQHKITFIEGSTFKEWRQQLSQAKGIIDDTAGLSEPEIAQLLNIDNPKLEGLMLPETYFYPEGTLVSALYRKSHKKLQAYLDAAWQSRDKNLPLKNAYEALILASIIEKETGLESERTTVGSVFINRLNKRMRLQTDPTVIYGMGDDYKGNIRRKHLRQKTAYNTYVIKRLPPTPIAMVGKTSIDAALHPATTNYLYFVASGDGGHYFSKNLKEHNRAVRKYILKK